MGLLQDIKTRLVASSVGTTSAGSTGWRIVYRELLPVVGGIGAQQIAIVPTGGYPEDGKPPIERPTFQVVVQGTSNASSGLEVKVDAVISSLNLYNGTLNGWTYVDIRRQGDKLWLGRRDDQHPVYAVNFLAVRSRTS